MSKVEINVDKIKSLEEIGKILEDLRARGVRIIHCHGVFDLLHPGHFRHFKEAKSKGDCLVVTVTPDRFVNKGPGRPVFSEALRLESLASLSDIDFVVLNSTPDAVSAIEKVRPHLYVKGIEYKNPEDDVTGKINDEVKAVKNCSGDIYYTDDIVFSSSSLLNRYFDSTPPKVSEFVSRLKTQYSSDDIVKKIEELKDLKVLVIGDAIIDEYQYTSHLGQSGKGLHMVARCKEKEVFLGGSLIIANHVAQFAGEVTLLTALGKECPYLNFVKETLHPNVRTEITYLENVSSLIKKRYVIKDGKALNKLFETYSGFEDSLNSAQTEAIAQFIQKQAKNFDLVLVCDFGNGFTNQHLVEVLSEVPSFLALNTQTNSGNRGFNVVTNYRRADYISLNEPELRLSAHDRVSSLEGIATDISQIMNCKTLSVTQGVNGVVCFSSSCSPIYIPALATNSIDRIGAGDSFLSLSSLCMAKRYEPLLGGFIGSVAAAMNIQVVGNQEPVKKSSLCKFVIRLMK